MKELRMLAQYHKCEDDLVELFQEIERNGHNFSPEQWLQIENVFNSLSHVKKEYKNIKNRYDLVDSFSNINDDSSSDDDDNDEKTENLLNTKMEFLTNDVDFTKMMENGPGEIFNQVQEDNVFQKENNKLSVKEWLALLMMKEMSDKQSAMQEKYPHILQFNNYHRKENTKRELNEVRKSLDGKNRFTRMADYSMQKLVNVLPLSAIDELHKMVPDIMLNSRTQNDILGGKKAIVDFKGVCGNADVVNDVVTEYLENVPMKLMNRLQNNDQQKISKL